MLATTDSQARMLAVEQTLQEEYTKREEKIVENYREHKDMEKYVLELRRNDTSFGHVIRNVEDYFS